MYYSRDAPADISGPVARVADSGFDEFQRTRLKKRVIRANAVYSECLSKKLALATRLFAIAREGDLNRIAF